MRPSSVDTTGAKRKIVDVGKQLRYARAVALTQTAKDVQVEIERQIPSIFDRPVAFTRRALAITPARVNSPVAEVFVKDIQAGYLAIEETGGVRRPAPGAPVILPVAIRVNVAGNIARGRIKAELAKPGTFVVGPKDAAARKLPPGIYRRMSRGRNKGKTVMLVSFKPEARYRPRFGFKSRAYRIASAAFPRNFRLAVERAFATAR